MDEERREGALGQDNRRVAYERINGNILTNLAEQQNPNYLDPMGEDAMRRLGQMKANKLRLELMDQNVDDVIAHIKNEITFAAKRDQQLVERLSKELCEKSGMSQDHPANGLSMPRESIFIRAEADLLDMQNKNAKLKKQIKDKIERIDMMERKLEEVAKETKHCTDVISLYSALLGISIEKIPGKEREFKIFSTDRPSPDKKAFEARIECRGKTRGQLEEYQVIIEKIPTPGMYGLQVGQKLIYDENQLSDLLRVMKEATDPSNN